MIMACVVAGQTVVFRKSGRSTYDGSWLGRRKLNWLRARFGNA